MRARRFWLLALVLLPLGPGMAGAAPIVDGGLNSSLADCVDTTPSTACDGAVQFVLTTPNPVTAIGTLTLQVDDTVDIILNVASYTMEGVLGNVEKVIFTDVDYTFDGIPVTIAGSQITQDFLPLVNGTVAGDYEQRNAADGVEVANQAFSDDSVVITNLSCLGNVCGFQLGTLSTGPFNLDIGGADHELTQVFNLSIPEPSTLGLVALGLAAIAATRRPRR